MIATAVGLRSDLVLAREGSQAFFGGITGGRD